ncbi:hypothetical protein [Pontibacter virosus]|uniref:Uncharacterized protein n=1 Tax=Pontibacter virosus TaxID=1765052 RepID=A0A2U1AZG9_9BACT|nr:hypothetical protein [Pontibacter virosus]PVY41826.1 hypothetical protein C8E01_104198 [Pontibacter virosus]
MPTIEIVSVGASRLSLNQSNFELALIEENKLKSHRGLFYDWLNGQEGVIVHLGNPKFKEDKTGGFFAGELIDWSFEPTTIELPNFGKVETGANQISGFRFLTNYQIEVALILEKAITASPELKVYFLTDIQFGAGNGKMEELNLKEFWTMHDTEGLKWNTLYKLGK